MELTFSVTTIVSFPFNNFSPFLSFPFMLSFRVGEGPYICSIIPLAKKTKIVCEDGIGVGAKQFLLLASLCCVHA